MIHTVMELFYILTMFVIDTVSHTYVIIHSDTKAVSCVFIQTVCMYVYIHMWLSRGESITCWVSHMRNRHNQFNLCTRPSVKFINHDIDFKGLVERKKKKKCFQALPLSWWFENIRRLQK